MPDPTRGKYRVVYFGVVRERLTVLAGKAKSLGLLAEYGAVLKRIDERLAANPIGWGEESRRLEATGIRLFRAAAVFLMVYYGVDQSRKIVYVKEIKPFPSHPLTTAP